MMGGPTFRPEATAAFLNTDTRGTVLSIAPPSAVATFGLATAILLSGLLLVGLGEVDVHAEGRGVVAPSEEPIRLRAPFSSFVLSVDKHGGDQGKTGETVVTLEIPPESRGAANCADLVRAGQERVETTEKQIVTLHEQKKSDAELLATLLGAQLASERSRLAATEERCKQTELLTAQAQVRLPNNGTISHIHVAPGQRVQGGEVLSTFLPNSSRLVVHVALSEAHRAGVEIGRPVRLRFDACPYQEHGVGEGKVTRLLDLDTDDERRGAPHDANGAGGGNVATGFVAEVEVSKLPAGYCSKLKPGMALTADVFVRRQSIAALFFRPLGER